MNARFLGLTSGLDKSCEWLYDKAEYTRWRSPSMMAAHHGCLWIKGKPGSGKTTLMKMVVENDETRPESTAVISHFFFRGGGDADVSTDKMYRSLLYQLLQRLPQLQSVLDIWSAANLPQGEWPTDLLRTVFRAAILRLGDDVLTCYIDALDECDENEAQRIIEFFEDLTESTASGNVRFLLCISSRHYPHITMLKCVELKLDYQDGHGKSISRYVKSRLKVVSSAQKRKLAGELCKRAAGVFLWVKLAVRELNNEDYGGNLHNLQDCLNRLPNDLPELFEMIVHKDLREDPAFIPTIQWTLFSLRPLRREELYIAVHSCLGRNDETSQTCETENMERFILRASKGFVELVKGKRPTFQFIHETVREYFISTGLAALSPTLNENIQGRSHHRLMQCCQNYLWHGVSAKVLLPASRKKKYWDEAARLREHMLEAYPFLEYALNGVIYHADSAHSHKVPQDEFLDTFHVELWKKLKNVLEKVRRYTKPLGRRWIFAEQGASFLLELDLQRCPAPSSESRHKVTVLGVAIERKHLRSVQVLLKYGMGAESLAKGTLSCLCLAVKQSSVQIVRALLEAGASVDAKAVQLSLQEGDLEVVQSLIGTDSSSQTYGQCLPTASFHNHLNIVQWLLEKGAEVDTTFENHMNALEVACGGERLAMITFLTNNGAGLDHQCGLNDTALSVASGRGNATIVQMLIDHGAQVDAPGVKSETALEAALRKGYREVVQILLESGADPNAPSSKLGSALHAAANSSSRFEQLQMLIDRGGNVNLQAGDYGSVLQAACVTACDSRVCTGSEVRAGDTMTRFCRARTVRLLLDRGAQINARGGHYGNALQAACAHSCKKVVRLLLDRGADPIAKGGYYGSIKSTVEANDRVDIAEMVIDATTRRLEILESYRAAMPGRSLATTIVLKDSRRDCEEAPRDGGQESRQQSVGVDLPAVQEIISEPACGTLTGPEESPTISQSAQTRVGSETALPKATTTSAPLASSENSKAPPPRMSEPKIGLDAMNADVPAFSTPWSDVTTSEAPQTGPDKVMKPDTAILSHWAGKRAESKIPISRPRIPDMKISPYANDKAMERTMKSLFGLAGTQLPAEVLATPDSRPRTTIKKTLQYGHGKITERTMKSLFGL